MLYASKLNRVYRISEKDKKTYLERGFDIVDETGKITDYAKDKTISYSEHLKEIENLKEQINNDETVFEDLNKLKEEIKTLTSEKDTLLIENTTLKSNIDTLTSERDTLADELNKLKETGADNNDKVPKQKN